ncbi:hypothetical protein [Variovorax sp. 22077]|uniref:hypothetical protein n=1 Tax=Variovorax sp. 22077 TaxID=3453867 RepID=UPI003F869339
MFVDFDKHGFSSLKIRCLSALQKPCLAQRMSGGHGLAAHAKGLKSELGDDFVNHLWPVAQTPSARKVERAIKQWPRGRLTGLPDLLHPEFLKHQGAALWNTVIWANPASRSPC